MFFKKKERERREEKKTRTTNDHTLSTEDYIGLQTSRSNIDKKLISYNTRRDTLSVVETGLRIEQESGVGAMGYLGDQDQG